ncbi:hypothetical protein TVAG_287950 [Trichomonas vaginalis G3]|uniref:Beige/BEACH domain containing protein n=1 Tax=Trichomonas vaginalis (strain ATCC PRA-98 / G3) TaxID=412133 RepID=A2ER62_TRIV3|nr:aggrephagy protein [Trichomonas vaginalis G3]EAY04881.1 hypothetical protein TVAG_287950 [Trichomonas vaginalis G3]KAI5549461.1 aggrephagy protein [Trichomonas vaginalis G3]|eukprot:XP_001317104.1 hypothetical protein [Trichomonas vaginalis G3]
MRYWADKSCIPPVLTQDLLNETIFFDLPLLSNNLIEILNTSIEKGSTFIKSLSQIGFNAIIPDITINKITERFNQPEISESSVVCLFFLVICILTIYSNQDSLNKLTKLFNLLNKITKTSYQNAFDELLISICELISNENNNYFNTELFTLIIQQLYINKTLGKRIARILIQLGQKIHSTDDSVSINNYLCFLDSTLKENKNKFTSEEMSAILTMSEPSFINLNPIAISIFANSSQIEMNKVIVRNFTMMDHFVIQKIRKSKTKLTNEDFITILPFDNSRFVEQQKNGDGFPIPPQSSVGADNRNVHNSFSWTFEGTINQIKNSIDNASIEVLNIISQTMFVTCQHSKCTEMYPDFIVYIISMLTIISKRVNVTEKFLNIIFDDFIFNHNCTIFHGELRECQQFVRNNAIQIADNEKLLHLVIQNISHDPLLLSEILTRILYILNSSSVQLLKNSGIESLIVGGLLMDPKNLPSCISLNITRGVPLEFLFDILNDDQALQTVFHSKKMLSVILSLAFEADIINSIVSIISRAIQNSQDLPESFLNFERSLFSSYVLDNIYQNESILFLNATLKAILQNAIVAIYFDPLIDEAIQIAMKQPSAELLNMILSVCTLICQSKKFNIDDRFEPLVKLFKIVYQEDPPESMIGKFLCMMNKSINTAQSDNFNISEPQFISLFFVTFCKSPFFKKVLEIFLGLCQYSEHNCYACHLSEIDVLISRGLVGPFTFRNIQIEIKLNEEVEELLYKIITLIMQVKSDLKCAQSIISCILPDENGNFSERSFKMLSVVNNISSNFSVNPSPQYSCSTPKPSLKLETNSSLFNNGYCFAFWLKADVNYIQNSSNKYAIFKAVDQNKNNIQLYLHGRDIILRFESDMITSSIITKKVKPSIWNFFVVCVSTNSKENYEVLCSVDHKMEIEISFRAIQLEGLVNIDFGFSEVSDKEKSVILGPFSFIQDSSYENFESITANGVDKCIYSNKNCKIHSESLESDNSVIGFFEKIDPLSIIDIFKYAKQAPPHVIELALLLAGKMNIIPINIELETIEDTCNEVKQTLGIEFDEKVKKIEIQKSSFLAFIYLLFQAQIPLPSSYFNPFITVYNRLKSKEFQYIIFNTFLWGDRNERVFRRIIDNWPRIDCEKPFTLILPQLLLNENCSKPVIFRVLDMMIKSNISRDERDAIIGCAIEDPKNASIYSHFMRVQNAQPCSQMSYCVQDEESFVELYKLVDGINTPDERLIKCHLAVSLFSKIYSEINFEDSDIVSIRSIVRGIPLRNIPAPDTSSEGWFILPLCAAVVSDKASDNAIIAEFLCCGLNNSKNLMQEFSNILCLFEALSIMGFDTWGVKCATISRLFFALMSSEIQISSSQYFEIVEMSLVSLFYKLSSSLLSKNLQMMVNLEKSDIVDSSFKIFETKKENETESIYQKMISSSIPTDLSFKFRIDVDPDDSDLLSALNNIAAYYHMFVPQKPKDLLIKDFIMMQNHQLSITPNFNSLFDSESPDKLQVHMNIEYIQSQIILIKLMLDTTKVSCNRQIEALTNAKVEFLSTMTTMLECGKTFVKRYIRL